MLNLNSIMIGTTQSQALATFYEKVIGKPADMVDSEQGFFGWQVGTAFISVLEHSEMGGGAKDPGRVKRVNSIISLVSGGLVLFLAGSAFLLSFDGLQSLAAALVR